VLRPRVAAKSDQWMVYVVYPQKFYGKVYRKHRWVYADYCPTVGQKVDIELETFKAREVTAHSIPVFIASSEYMAYCRITDSIWIIEKIIAKALDLSLSKS
jgi:hypothetical protein